MGIEPSEVIVIIVSLLENAGLEHCIHAVNICCMHASLNKKYHLDQRFSNLAGEKHGKLLKTDLWK